MNNNWKPGVSGNPAGRPKGAINKKRRDLDELLTDKIVDRAFAILDKELDPKAKYRIDVAKFVVDQKFGKARQRLDIGNPDDGSPAFLVWFKKEIDGFTNGLSTPTSETEGVPK